MGGAKENKQTRNHPKKQGGKTKPQQLGEHKFCLRKDIPGQKITTDEILHLSYHTLLR